MQARRFAGRDDVGGRARALGFRYLDVATGAECGGDAIDRVNRLGGSAFEVAAGDRDAHSVKAAVQNRRHSFGIALGANGIVCVVALHGVIDDREIARAARQRTDVIEACGKWERACPAQASVGRLQSEQTAQRGRHANRAVGIGAERKWHQAAGDGGGRSARRTAGHPGEVVRIARRTVVHILAGEVVGVFAHVERADQNGAGGLKTLDQCRIASGRRKIAVYFRAGHRRQTGNVEQVLHRKRHAGKRRQRFAARPRVVQRPRA